MTWQQMLAAVFATIFSVAYLGGVTAIGFLTATPLAWKGGLIALGVCHLCFMLQTVKPEWRTAAGLLAFTASVMGVIGGMALLAVK